MRKELNIHVSNNDNKFFGDYYINIDIKKLVYEASSIGGYIYCHPLIFSSIYKLATENIDKSYSIDPNGVGLGTGTIQIIVTDLIPENEYRVMTKIQFYKEFNSY